MPNKNNAMRKGRRSYSEMFLEKLGQLSGGEQKFIGNKNLRENLGWDNERYERIRSQLLDEKVILVGRGKGGSVSLVNAPGTEALKVFISYSHFDEILKVDLMKHLSPLHRLKLVDSWHDRKIKAGDEWEKSISSNLEDADIILLLVSIDFINSDYCYDIEMDKALELHAAKSATVIPIILRSCLWQHTPFAKIQALPKDAKPISAWPDRDEAFVSVVEGIRQVAEDILATK